MNSLKIMLIFLLALLSACSLIEPLNSNHQVARQIITQAPLAENEVVYWVNSLRADCIGVTHMSCLQVQESDAVTQNTWQLFYSSIEGFSYEAGYIYKLLLKKENLSIAQVPAEGSSIKYSLVEVLEKTVDAKLRLNDIWALEAIQGETLILERGLQRPRLEIQLRDMKLTGNDGCNAVFASIDFLDDGNITFGPIAGTLMYCQTMDLPDRFNQQLAKVAGYQLADLKLHLLDSAGKELLLFRKID